MADTVKRFHADQEAPKEFQALNEILVAMEIVIKLMLQLPALEKLVENAADLSSE